MPGDSDCRKVSFLSSRDVTVFQLVLQSPPLFVKLSLFKLNILC